jgi:hypothetical protein
MRKSTAEASSRARPVSKEGRTMKHITLALALLFGAGIPADAGPKKHSQQVIESTAWLDAWATVAGARCKQNEVVFNIASAKIAALVETFSDKESHRGNGADA